MSMSLCLFEGLKIFFVDILNNLEQCESIVNLRIKYPEYLDIIWTMTAATMAAAPDINTRKK